jgi:5-formyltetrahydrofolate cyclo-ligase
LISPANALSKAALRGAAITRRDTLTSAERERASASISERAIAIVEDSGARVIAAYMPIWSEVDVRPVISWAHDNGLTVVLPAVIDKTTIAFRRHEEGGPLDEGRFGTQAPPAHAEIVRPDLIVSPTIAFDRTGMRLGYGGGFYDRAFAKLREGGEPPILVGLAFAAQEVPAIPAERHDVRMDWIVTENEALDFRRTLKG